MKQFLVMILISGAIGWITNWVAIKMLFRPHKEINFGLFKIQGLIPKRRAEIGSGIANIIQYVLILFLLKKLLFPLIYPKKNLKFYQKL